MRAAQPPSRAAMGQEGPRPFACMALNVGGRSFSGNFRAYNSRNRRARIRASRNRIITERHFEQGPPPRQWIEDLLPTDREIGAAVVILAVVVVAGAVASLRI